MQRLESSMTVANGPKVSEYPFLSVAAHIIVKNVSILRRGTVNRAQPFTEETIQTILSYMEPEYVKGITLLGGEPLEHSNQKGLLPLVRVIKKEKYPNKSIWCFTGYDFEKDILGRMVNEWEETRELLSYIEVLVDGEFMIDKKDLGLVFRGSSNQRNILVQESLKKRKDLSLDTGSLKDRGKDYGFLVRYPE